MITINILGQVFISRAELLSTVFFFFCLFLSTVVNTIAGKSVKGHECRRGKRKRKLCSQKIKKIAIKE